MVHHQLPIKLFVLNNNGYLSIRTTQKNFFCHLVGEGPTSGVTFPDMVRIAEAYGMPACRVKTADEFGRMVEQLNQPGPMLIDVLLDATQEFEPRMRSRQMPDGSIVTPSLEDMYPFLEPEELAENMVTKEGTHIGPSGRA